MILASPLQGNFKYSVAGARLGVVERRALQNLAEFFTRHSNSAAVLLKPL